jgi:hypothetical protein
LAASLEKPLSFDTTYLPRRYIEEPRLEEEVKVRMASEIVDGPKAGSPARGCPRRDVA